MTEVKNTSLDLLTRQPAGNGKKEEKSVDVLSGFKSMLKNKSQKIDGDSKDDESKTETAVAMLAADMIGMLKPEEQVQISEQGLEELGVNPVEEQTVVLEETGTGQIMNQFQPMDQFRFQQLTGKTSDMDLSEIEEGTALPEEIQGTDFMNAQMMSAAEEGQKKSSIMMPVSENVLQQTKAEGAKSEEDDGIRIDSLLLSNSAEIQSTAKEEPAIMVQSGRMNEQQTSSEEDEKKPDEFMGVFQEKSYEPDQTLSIHTENDITAYTTVNVEDLNDLEAKLSEQILKQIDSGKKELEVQLEPQNLGKIRIKISYEENQVNVSVLCTESKTLKLLSQSAGDLGTILESNLERPIQIFVDKQEADYLNNQQEQDGRQQQQQQQQGKRREENQEDFIQKLRLGIFGTDSKKDS